jgi:hypothetical protein
MATNFNPRLYARSYSYGTPAVGPRSNPGPCPDPCQPPPCADCGSLECFCRPRFFAGQLLTEKDLNRLDQYVRGKNRLHALQLFGAGVVNGLIVRCEPCGKGVTVGQGYAISPCGDDIVVCEDFVVDVCALIKKCQPVDPSCAPFQGATARGCEDIIEDWVLSIRYAESPARGVAALRMGPSCSCGATNGSCGCGPTSAGGGCRCGAKSTATCTCKGRSAGPANGATGGCGSTTTKPRVSPPECEPTAICEGYSFDVALLPNGTYVAGKAAAATLSAAEAAAIKDAIRLRGPLWQQFECCFRPLADAIPALPDNPRDLGAFTKNADLWHLWSCQTKAVFVGYFSSGSTRLCTLAGRLAMCPVPDPTNDPNLDNFAKQMSHMVAIFVHLYIEAMRDCLCTALLPPPPWGTNDDRIPLAIVRVRKKDCMVIDICNWTQLRPIVLTFPTIEYWLSISPWPLLPRDIVHKLCCGGASSRAAPATSAPAPGVAGTTASASAGDFVNPYEAATLETNPTLSKKAMSADAIFGNMVADAVARGTTPLDPNDIVGSLFGVDLGGRHPLSAGETANVPQFVVLNEILRPVVNDVLSGLKTSGTTTGTDAGAAGGAGSVSSLEARVAALEAVMSKSKGP